MKTKLNLPWKLILNNPDKDSSPVINGANGEPIATIDSGKGIDKIHGAFIVTACNAHEDLVKAAEIALAYFDKAGIEAPRTRQIINDALAKAGVKI